MFDEDDIKCLTCYICAKAHNSMQAIPVVRTGMSSTTSATSLLPTTTFPIQTLRFAGMGIFWKMALYPGKE